MPKQVSGRRPLRGEELISLAQKLARDAERHAILSASVASQAVRLWSSGSGIWNVAAQNDRSRLHSNSTDHLGTARGTSAAGPGTVKCARIALQCI